MTTDQRPSANGQGDGKKLSAKPRFVGGRSALAMLIAGLATGSAAAFSIEGVTVGPRPLTPSSPLTLTVYVLTPTAPAGLYAPTQVSRSNQNVHVDIYPTSDMLQMIDSMDVAASLGTFEVGDNTGETVITCQSSRQLIHEY